MKIRKIRIGKIKDKDKEDKDKIQKIRKIGIKIGR